MGPISAARDIDAPMRAGTVDGQMPPPSGLIRHSLPPDRAAGNSGEGVTGHPSEDSD